MKVDRINHYKQLFLKHVLSLDSNPTAFHYECQATWQAFWDPYTEDLAKTYDRALHSKISNRLWGGQKDSPKSTMIELIQHNEVMMAAAFADLLDQNKDLGLRLDRFAFHCDEVFYSLMYNSNRLNTHHHADRKYPLMYLCFTYPDQYGLWDYKTFYLMLQKLESRNIPHEVEVERYYKIQRAIYTVLSKDVGFISKVMGKLSGNQYKDKTLLLINDFQSFVASQP